MSGLAQGGSLPDVVSVLPGDGSFSDPAYSGPLRAYCGGSFQLTVDNSAGTSASQILIRLEYSDAQNNAAVPDFLNVEPDASTSPPTLATSELLVDVAVGETKYLIVPLNFKGQRFARINPRQTSNLSEPLTVTQGLVVTTCGGC